MSTGQARALRRTATLAERRLWSRLRNRQVCGLKFRRQETVGRRIVDFYCAEAKLAVELDGSGHRRHASETADLDKELELHERGIRTLRFANTAVLSNTDGVLNEIIFAIKPEKSLWAGADPMDESS
jgi:very-short-patch-repair endonuclease